MTSEKPAITPLKNGPLKVTNLTKFTNSRQEPITAKPTIILCRCGASHTKPFCDGTHMKTGFTDEKRETQVPDKRDVYHGKGITILDNRDICAHSGNCTDNLPGVFRMGVEPWIDPNGASVQEIIRVIEMCPSGALAYMISNQEVINRDAEPAIHISKNGPYHVCGSVELKNHELGEGASREHYTLCRCGHSGNKPRCDGSHWYADFQDDEALTIGAANRAREQKEPEWIKAADPDELKEGGKKKIEVEGQTIVLSRVNGTYGAISGYCPHQGGPLVDGRIDNGVIHCPWHGHAFDPVTGRAHGEDADVPSFKVEERNDGIYIEVTAPSRSEWTVSHVMIETMVNWGITHVFGMVGHSNLGLAEAVRIQEEKEKLTYIGIRHEGAAAFACSGYAKAGGRPAACLTIAGPGATNLLTGLWDAKMDRTPVLALTGQVKTQVLGPGSFQEIDLSSAFESVSEFSQTVLATSNYPELISLALKHAMIQRDVSHLIFPDEIQTMDAGETGPGYPEGRVSNTRIVPPETSLQEAVWRITRAKRPVIIVGYGARDSMDAVIGLAEELNCPVITTFKGKGQISDFHPLGAGVLGRSGTQVGSWFMNNADLLIVFGSSFSHHTGIDKSKPIIQIDFDRMALGKFHSVATPVWGEITVTATMLAGRLPERINSVNCKDEIAERWKLWREEKKRRAEADNGAGMHSARIFEILTDEAPEHALISVDVGNNTYSFGRYFESKNQRVILSGYLGSIGFSFPAAMGAYMADTGRPIVSISGDGGFGQYMGEFNTAVKYNMNITHILLNNGELGKISKEQRSGGWKVWQTSLHNPNFSDYAKLCGGFGIRVENDDSLRSGLQKAFSYDGPALVEIISDPTLI
jgi:pyruvate oxidase